MKTYTKSLTTDFGNNLDAGQFHQEIIDDTIITTELNGITVYDDIVDIIFISALSGPEATQLNVLIGSHTPNPSGWECLSSGVICDVYDSTGGIETTASAILGLDTIRTNVGGFTLSNNTITIPEIGNYKITLRISTELASGVNGENGLITKCCLEKDTGGGFVEIPGSYSYAYNKVYNAGEGTASVTLIIDLYQNDKIRAKVMKIKGDGTIRTIANSSSLTLYKLFTQTPSEIL